MPQAQGSSNGSTVFNRASARGNGMPISVASGAMSANATATFTAGGVPIRAPVSQGEMSAQVVSMTAIAMTGPVIEAPAPRRALR